jgi:hypothetical protein
MNTTGDQWFGKEDDGSQQTSDDGLPGTPAIQTTTAPNTPVPGLVVQHRFLVLFVTLLAFLLLVPVLQRVCSALAPHAPPMVEAFMFVLLLAGTVYSVSTSRAGKLAGLGMAFPAAVLSILHGFSGASPVGIARHLLGIAFLSYAIVLMMRFIFTRQKVTMNTIFASLCIYMLIGFAWALAYSVADAFDPDAFKSTIDSPQAFAQFGIRNGQTMPVLYFSFCTLTTLGYGDFLPTSGMARALATLEAITGQLYLVVLVSRLVGLHIADSMGPGQR